MRLRPGGAAAFHPPEADKWDEPADFSALTF